jgi:hypothetical protein
MFLTGAKFELHYHLRALTAFGGVVFCVCGLYVFVVCLCLPNVASISALSIPGYYIIVMFSDIH